MTSKTAANASAGCRRTNGNIHGGARDIATTDAYDHRVTITVITRDDHRSPITTIMTITPRSS